MAGVKDSFLDLERHRILLEENTAKLRDSLARWRLWEAEYEGLKDEITSVPQPASNKHLARLRRDFDGQVVTKKEVSDIFGRTDLRSADQILSALSRRLDYVYQNVQTLTKQVEAAENKLAAANVVSRPDLQNEDGDFMTDIFEQLDDDDNVVSFRLQNPGETAPQVLEILDKAGITDVVVDANQDAELEQVEETRAPPKPIVRKDDTPRASAAAEAPSPVTKTAPVKKGVSFAEDTKPGHESSNPTAQRSVAAQRLDTIMQAAKEQEVPPSSVPVIPTNESAEDAALRREMLEYSLSEIGPVVAELQLEEADSDDSFDGYSDEEEESEDEDEDDEEDEQGRSKYSALNNNYRQRMMELEARLASESFFTTGEPRRPMTTADEGVGRISVVEPPTDSQILAENVRSGAVETADGTKKKSVQFAESLVVAPKDKVSSTTVETAPQVDPLSDVVERSGRATISVEKSTRKPSRFKKERLGDAGSSTIAALHDSPNQQRLPKGPQDAPGRLLDAASRVAPSGPEGQTIADSIVERDSVAATEDPGELDANLLHQQMATRYHEMRNRFIQRDGGYLKDDSSVVKPLDEEEGGPRRMSKFKAARLSKN